MLSKIVLNYQLQVNNMRQLIEINGYRNDDRSQKIGLKPANFSLKKQKGNWTSQEMLKLPAIIESKKVEGYMDEIKMHEHKQGTFISLDEFEKRMGWK